VIYINCQVIYSISDLTRFSLNGNDKFVNSLRYINYKQPNKSDNILDFEIKLGPFKPDLENCFILDDKYYIKHNYIYCKDKYKLLNWEIEIKDFENNSPIKIRINVKHDILFRIVAYPIISGFIIDSMIYYSLISKGFAPIHASCASKDNKAYIFPGRSGVGKTSVILQLIKNGYKYVNDDIVILCPGNTAIGFIKSLNIFSYNIDNQFYSHLKFSDKLKIKFYNVIYKLSNGYIKILTNVNPANIFYDNIDRGEIDVKSIFLLIPKKGLANIKGCEISKDEIISNIYYNQSIEMFYFYKYFLAYSYVYPATSIVNIYDRYKDNLNKNLHNYKFYNIEVPLRYNKNIFKEIFNLVSNS
jgi:hypothetical protein